MIIGAHLQAPWSWWSSRGRERRVDADQWRSGPAAMTSLSASNWPSAAGHHAADPPTVTG